MRKETKQVEKSTGLVAAIIIIICMLLIMIQAPTNAQSHLKKYRTMQGSVEYPAWQAKQKQVRIYRAKAGVKSSKEFKKNNNQTARFNEKIARIKSRSK